MHAGDGPIFVIGNPRSGTTLLRLMLTCHPRIAIPPEAPFLIELQKEFGGYRGEAAETERFVSALAKTPKFEYWKLPEALLHSALSERRPRDYASLVDAVYRCYATVHQNGKPRWGDKNNAYLAYIETIAALFPSAVFVHIVRDGRDVACSYRSLAGVRAKYAPTLPSDVFDAVFEWKRNLERIRRSFARIGWERACELRYEDLVREPERQLRSVCEFLREDYSPRMRDYDRENRDRELEPRDFDAWKLRNRSGIDEAAIDRWKTDLSPEEAALAAVAGAGMLSHYNYEASRHGVSARLGYAGRAALYHLRRWKKRFATRPTSSSS